MASRGEHLVHRAAFQLLTAFLVLASFGGCATVPETVVTLPTTVRPTPQVAAPANGTIFQADAYRPLFEDRRPRRIGDSLTVAINENTSASKAAASSGGKSGSLVAGITSLFGLSAGSLQKSEVSAKSDGKFEDRGAVNSSNNFSGVIAVTVVDVLPNGNLVVSGEKQIALDKGTEFIRLSGIVTPDTITTGNVVSSTQVADVRVEYRTNSRIDAAEVSIWLARFFLSVLPL
jgi:flagellar L-ring protein precursor FlgH